MPNFLSLFRKKPSSKQIDMSQLDMPQLAVPGKWVGTTYVINQPQPWGDVERREGNSYYDMALDMFSLLPEDKDTIQFFADKAESYIDFTCEILSRTADRVNYEEIVASSDNEADLVEFRKQVVALISMRSEAFNAVDSAYATGVIAEVEARLVPSTVDGATLYTKNAQGRYEDTICDISLLAEDETVLDNLMFPYKSLNTSYMKDRAEEGRLFYEYMTVSSEDANEVRDYVKQVETLIKIRTETDSAKESENIEQTLTDLAEFQAQK